MDLSMCPTCPKSGQSANKAYFHSFWPKHHFLHFSDLENVAKIFLEKNSKFSFLGFFPKQHTIAAIDAVKYSFWREKKILTYFCAMNMFRWTCLLSFLHQNSSGDFCIFSMLTKFSNPVFQNLTIFAALHPMLRLHFFSKAFDVQRVLFTFLRSKSCRNIYRRQNLDHRVP